MELISGEERDRYFSGFQREALHLEMRDVRYGTQAELPHLAKWLAGRRRPRQPRGSTRGWTLLRAGTCSRASPSGGCGSSLSRSATTSAGSITTPTCCVDAGEDIRWLPRRLVSALAFPGNDFWLFDEQTVVFTVFAGSGLVVERQRSSDPAVIQLCKSSFEAAWPLSIPHREYTVT